MLLHLHHIIPRGYCHYELLHDYKVMQYLLLSGEVMTKMRQRF